MNREFRHPTFEEDIDQNGIGGPLEVKIAQEGLVLPAAALEGAQPHDPAHAPRPCRRGDRIALLANRVAARLLVTCSVS
jgi:hypothetical protein